MTYLNRGGVGTFVGCTEVGHNSTRISICIDPLFDLDTWASSGRGFRSPMYCLSPLFSVLRGHLMLEISRHLNLSSSQPTTLISSTNDSHFVNRGLSLFRPPRALISSLPSLSFSHCRHYRICRSKFRLLRVLSWS